MRKWLFYISMSLLIVLILILAFNFKADIPIEKLKEKYSNEASQFIDVQGMSVHYRDEGQGPVLILLHGTAASLHTWEAWVKDLKSDYRVIRMDLPAFGLTGSHPQHQYKIDDYVSFVEAFADSLSLDHFHLGGNSLGGSISWQFAGKHPDRVDKLILLDPGGIPSGKKRPFVFRLARTPVLNQIVRYVTPRFFIEKNLKQVYYDDSKISPELIDRYYEMTLRTNNRQAFIERSKLESSSQPELLNTIQSETLIQWGAEDTWIPVRLADAFKERIPKAEVIIYPKVGHVPMEESPQETVKDVLAFLKK